MVLVRSRTFHAFSQRLRIFPYISFVSPRIFGASNTCVLCVLCLQSSMQSQVQKITLNRARVLCVSNVILGNYHFFFIRWIQWHLLSQPRVIFSSIQRCREWNFVSVGNWTLITFFLFVSSIKIDFRRRHDSRIVSVTFKHNRLHIRLVRTFLL